MTNIEDSLKEIIKNTYLMTNDSNLIDLSICNKPVETHKNCSNLSTYMNITLHNIKLHGEESDLNKAYISEVVIKEGYDGFDDNIPSDGLYLVAINFCINNFTIEKNNHIIKNYEYLLYFMLNISSDQKLLNKNNFCFQPPSQKILNKQKELPVYTCHINNKNSLLTNLQVFIGSAHFSKQNKVDTLCLPNANIKRNKLKYFGFGSLLLAGSIATCYYFDKNTTSNILSRILKFS